MTIEDKTNTSVGKRAKFQEPYGPVIDTFRLTFKSKKLTRLRKYFARHVGKRIIVLGFCNVEKFSAAIESVPMKNSNDHVSMVNMLSENGQDTTLQFTHVTL